jgi:cytochrome c-type biogenesis protein CcmH
MIFWSLAIVVTVVACAALYYAGAGRKINAAEPVVDSPEVQHLKLQLKEIEADAANGRLGAAEALAAKGELARELLRLKAELKPQPTGAAGRRGVVAAASVATAILALGVYGALGRPDLPAQPLAERTDVPPPQMTLDDAIARIEAQLSKNPTDLRGWTVIAPAYMQMGRYADAVTALRKVIELDGPTAERETDLGEALMMSKNGDATGEPLELFRSAAARDPAHVRSRYYIASEATREGDYENAKAEWEALLKLGKGDEPWYANATAGLAAAEAGLSGGQLPDGSAIAGMVQGLSDRLMQSGGTAEEWTRLVRSRLVLGQTELAQQAYDAARKAYPDAGDRAELDVLAADNGLVANN